MPARSSLAIPLPLEWPQTVKRAALLAVGFARAALLEVQQGFDNGRSPRAQQTAENARLRSRLAALEEEIRIKDARIVVLPPGKRPHYPSPERLAILSPRAATGWSTADTAR